MLLLLSQNNRLTVWTTTSAAEAAERKTNCLISSFPTLGGFLLVTNVPVSMAEARISHMFALLQSFVELDSIANLSNKRHISTSLSTAFSI